MIRTSRWTVGLGVGAAFGAGFLVRAHGQGALSGARLAGLEAPPPLAGAFGRRLGGASKGASSARLAASDARLTKLEALMVGIVNDERAGRGLRRLENDARLAEVARAHSAEMRDKGYFAHESPTPELREPLDRYVAGMGDKPHIVAENIYRVWGSHSFLTEKDVRDAHEALMKSPGHRANLLQSDVTRLGIGFACDSTGNLWITQMFSDPF